MFDRSVRLEVVLRLQNLHLSVLIFTQLLDAVMLAESVMTPGLIVLVSCSLCTLVLLFFCLFRFFLVLPVLF